MTEKLYEADAYCKTFHAVVKECRSCDGNYNGKYDGKYAVILDRTAFFPEGGGQPADLGKIDGLTVTDVQILGGEIVHIVEPSQKVHSGADATDLQEAVLPETGKQVECEIDWELRYARMQSHTGEHILSGVVHRMYGYDNVGFDMNETSMRVDFSGSLSVEDIAKIEIEANKAVYRNEQVRAYYPEPEELTRLEYRSKKELDGDVRIVTIGEDIDCCACCAPHVATTGEIGLIKVIDFYSYKGGARLEMTAGIHALTDYMQLNDANRQMMRMLSVPRDVIAGAVEEKNTAYQNLRYEYENLLKRLALCELSLVNIGNSVYAIAENLSFDQLRYCANTLSEDYSMCLLLSANGETAYTYVVSSGSGDVRPFVKELNAAFAGKGGGQSGYAQGKMEVSSKEELVKFIEGKLGE